MAKKTKLQAAKTKPPATPGDRISINDALKQLLAAGYQPHVAAEAFNTGWRENTVRLWCNGNLLSPSFIRTELVVLVNSEADGRWLAVVVPVRGAWENKDYNFEVDPSEIRKLLRTTSARRKPGTKPTKDWHTEIAAWLHGGPR